LLTDYSKTFLARLCEQAERYDGAFTGHSRHCERVLTEAECRNGFIHEGEQGIELYLLRFC
jgi:hypothetical protein